ncbi:MAG: MFS transporter [Bdellovibrionales bacterium]|jgi:MFS family permease
MNIAGNIWKLQADRFFSNFWLHIAILVPFFESNGLSATQIFLTETIFAVVTALSEIPTGYLSDVIGRKKCFVIGSALIPVSMTVYAFSHTFWAFAGAETIMGIALAFRSGTDSSFLYDTLLELKREKEHKRIEGTALFLREIGSGIANILGGLLATISLTLPFVVNVFTSLVLLPLALATKEPKRESSQSQNAKAHAKDMGRTVLYCAKHPILRNATLYMALINGLGIIGYWMEYLLYSKIGITVTYFGFLAATCSLMTALGSKALHPLDKKMGERFALALPLFMGTCMVAIGLLQSLWSLPFVFLNSFLWGLSIPLLRDILHKNTGSSIRATVLSVTSMSGRLVFIAFSAGMGHLIDLTNIQTGFLCLGSLFLVTTALPAMGLMRAR